MRRRGLNPTSRHPRLSKDVLQIIENIFGGIIKQLIAIFILAGGLAYSLLAIPRDPHPLVLMTDFGERDGAVSAMKGVAMGVSSELPIHDLTHAIPPYDIWEGAYRLHQTYAFWPEGTVFVAVVDPGVGSDRKPIVARDKTGHFFVLPDNGLLTFLADDQQIEAVRIIDETRHRLKGSEKSYTFHGRDLFAYTGARLATGDIGFEDMGPALKNSLVTLKYQKAEATGGRLTGNIPVLDLNYGNVWTNIPSGFLTVEPKSMHQVKVFKGKNLKYSGEMPFAKTFSDVPEGKPLLYTNSLLNLSLALNMASFSEKFKIGSGPEWRIEIE